MIDKDIVDRALAFIGEVPATSMTDTARGAKRAIASYPLCRDEVLRLAIWTCAMRREWLYDCAQQATPWTASYHYAIGERCTNNTNKTYQCTVEGKSAAATGPTGTSTGIVDGTVQWNYIEVSSATTNWCHWPTTAYRLGDLVSWDTGKVYLCVQAGTSAAANPPIGTAPDIVDGTVRWQYYATIRPNRTVYCYQYVLPPDCLRVIKVPSPTVLTESGQGVQYLIEGRFLFTDLETAVAKYVYRAEPQEWDALLQGTIALRIAAEIAYDVTGKETLMQNAFQALNGQYASARSIAQHEGQEGTPEITAWQNV